MHIKVLENSNVLKLDKAAYLAEWKFKSMREPDWAVAI
jgi:hypothetical protein